MKVNNLSSELYIEITKGKPIIFENWLEVNENKLEIYFAETGSDRELDFDYEGQSELIYNSLLALYFTINK
jgi:hypothetical protein